MLVGNNYVPKREVVYVSETVDMEKALAKLKESGYRCIPVLDEKEEKYVGNIYKLDLLKREVDNQLDNSLNSVIRDQSDGYVNQDAPFFKVFTTIRRLPFLAVVDEEKTFLGILTNGNVIDVLEDSWDVKNGSYSLTIGTLEYAGALQHMLGIINEYASVRSVITLKDTLKFVRRVTVVLPKEIDQETLDQITHKLDQNNFTVIHVEQLHE